MSASGAADSTLLHATGWQLVLTVFAHMQSMDDLPKLTTATFIGIMVAITGNVLISLALNLQKLAHKQMEDASSHERNPKKGQSGEALGKINNPRRHSEHGMEEGTNRNESNEAHFYTPTFEDHVQSGIVIPTETQSSTPFPTIPPSSSRDYGTMPGGNSVPDHSKLQDNHSFLSRYMHGRFNLKKNSPNRHASLEAPLLPVDVISEETALHRPSTRQRSVTPQLDVIEDGNEAEYLKSKLWWLGFLLMNVGEIGNFISYAWAPASVVAPLGTFSLMANCIFAPILLGERFRKRDLLGILIAIIGAVTVVLASNASDARLDPDTLLLAITQLPFIIYSCIYVGIAIILATLSQGSIGRRWVFVDVGLCALFGGFTVLSTKAISTLLTMKWVEIFSYWITYPVLAILILTGIGQIRYLNRALMRFDSKVVIPVQFVLFTLSAIIGSAILYGDFKKAKFHQVVTFLYGCAATFLGVFIIAWAPTSHDDGMGSDGRGTSDSHPTTAIEETGLGLGTPGQRRRATLVLPSDTRDVPILRSPHNAISLIGLSPAQHLLLVHTPSREVPMRAGSVIERRRTMSWLGDATREGITPSSTRGSSPTERLGHSAGVHVGSSD